MAMSILYDTLYVLLLPFPDSALSTQSKNSPVVVSKSSHNISLVAK
jgi:hypothetical protein